MSKNRALIVVDIQNDFLPGGSLAVEGGDEIVDSVNTLIRAFDTVVLTADWHPENHISFAVNHAGKNAFETIDVKYGKQVLWPKHCVAGSTGAAFCDKLDTDRAAVIIRKGMNADCDSYSGFMEADRKTTTGLAGWLKERGIDEVWVCGLATDFCVAWTAQDAKSAGFETYLIQDASKAIDIDGSLAAAKEAWEALGVVSADIRQALGVN